MYLHHHSVVTYITCFWTTSIALSISRNTAASKAKCPEQQRKATKNKKETPPQRNLQIQVSFTFHTSHFITVPCSLDLRQFFPKCTISIDGYRKRMGTWKVLKVQLTQARLFFPGPRWKWNFVELKQLGWFMLILNCTRGFFTHFCFFAHFFLLLADFLLIFYLIFYLFFYLVFYLIFFWHF